MRVAVTGGRTYDNWQLVHDTLTRLHTRYGIFTLFHGGAKGADTHASTWAWNNHVHTVAFTPDWDEYGNRAGIIRNNEMLDQQPNLVVAFEGGKGTRHMKSSAAARGIPTLVIPDPEWRVRQPAEDIGHDLIVTSGDLDEPFPNKPFWLCRPTEQTRIRPKEEIIAQRQAEAAASRDRYRDVAIF